MNVELRGVLREIAGCSSIEVSVEETVSLEMLKRQLGIAANIPVVACIDGQHMPSDHPFTNADTISLLPVVAGG